MSKIIWLTENGEEAYNKCDFSVDNYMDVEEMSVLSHLMQDPSKPVNLDDMGYELKITKEDLDKLIPKMERKGEIIVSDKR